MEDVNKHKKELMKNSKFHKAYQQMESGFEFASMLISKRLENNMTQKELAEKLETTQSAVSRMESGDYNPSLKTLNRIAEVFDSKVELRLK